MLILIKRVVYVDKNKDLLMFIKRVDDNTVLPVDQPLHNGALSLAEPLGCIPPSRVGQELRELVLGGDVVLKGHVGHLDVLAAPLPEELHLGDLGNDRGGGQLLHGLTGPIFSHLDRVFFF